LLLLLLLLLLLQLLLLLLLLLLHGQTYLLGYSNGGMMAQSLLCWSALFRQQLTAVALVSTAVQQEYVPANCPYGQFVQVPALNSSSSSSNGAQQPLESSTTSVFQSDRQLPVIFIQGMQDSLFPFAQPAVTAGSYMSSVCEWPYCCTAVLMYCCTAVLMYCCTAVLMYYWVPEQVAAMQCKLDGCSMLLSQGTCSVRTRASAASCGLLTLWLQNMMTWWHVMVPSWP
jgi:hypothetical protein